MKKIVITIMLICTSWVSAAGQETAIDTSGLSKEAIIELNQRAQSLKKEPTNVSATVRKEAEEWGNLGANMGKAMIGAAREIGVAANDFVSTPLGKVTAALVVYKLIGRDIIDIVTGLITLITGTVLSVWLAMSQAFYTRKYETKSYLFGFWNRRIISEVEVEDSIALAKMAGQHCY